MPAGTVQLDDCFAEGELDAESLQREARRLLSGWTRTDVETVRARTRRLGLWTTGALVAAYLVPTATEPAELLTSVAVSTLLVGTGSVWSLHALFRGVDRPEAAADGEASGLQLVGLLVLVGLAYAATRRQAGRTLWRVLLRSAPFSPDGRTPDPGGDRPDSVVWVRRAVGAAAAVVVADASWVLLTRTGGARLLRRPTTGGSSLEALAAASTGEAALLYVTLLLVGTILAVTLSARA
jgi:hypothetical protein